MLRKKPKERIEDVSTPVDREDVLGLVGVYVDDTLVTGPKNICEGVVKALQKLWKTGDPEFLTPSTPFRFLGVKVVLTKFGLYLHQHFYADEFLKKHVSDLTVPECEGQLQRPNRSLPRVRDSYPSNLTQRTHSTKNRSNGHSRS